MTYQTEFADFDPATMPVIPNNWVDQSWHNDACPCFNAGNGKVVFIDYTNPEQREFQNSTRFSVVSDDSNKSLLETDDWQAVLGEVAR